MNKLLNIYRFDSLEERKALVEKYGESFFYHVPNRDYENEGFLYEDSAGVRQRNIAMWTSASINNLKSDPNYRDTNIISFQEAMEESLESQVRRAYYLIGKKCKTGVLDITPTHVSIYTKESGKYPASAVVDSYLTTHPFCVALSGNGLTVTLKDIVLLPESKTIQLTEDYEAVIYKDKVQVGCQTITLDKIKEILAENEKL